MMSKYTPEPNQEKEPYKWFAYWFYKLNPHRHSSFYNVTPATKEERERIGGISSYKD